MLSSNRGVAISRSIIRFNARLRGISRFFLISRPRQPPRSRAVTHRLATACELRDHDHARKIQFLQQARRRRLVSRSASATIAASARRSKSCASPSGPATGTFSIA